MRESVTLPRSGVVLERELDSSIRRGFRVDANWVYRVKVMDVLAIEMWDAGKGEWRACIGGADAFVGPQDHCIACLDARVLSLRAALLAGARETVNDALVEAAGDETWPIVADKAVRERFIDAVLLALGGGGAK